MIEIPYMIRVATLLMLALIIVWYDRSRHKGSTHRIWEYGSLFAAGTLGALYGAFNDAVTSRLSPEYFSLGKGLDGNASLRFQAVVLGAQAGFSAGVIACAIWQFILRRIPARQRCLAILRHIWLPLALAALLSILLPIVWGRADPLDFASRLSGILSDSDLTHFLNVWWVHFGAYSGLTMGLAIGILLTIKRKRRESDQ